MILHFSYVLASPEQRKNNSGDAVLVQHFLGSREDRTGSTSSCSPVNFLSRALPMLGIAVWLATRPATETLPSALLL